MTLKEEAERVESFAASDAAARMHCVEALTGDVRDLLCQVAEEWKAFAGRKATLSRRLGKAAGEDPRLVSEAGEAAVAAKAAAKAAKEAAWQAASARRVACFKATHKGNPLPW